MIISPTSSTNKDYLKNTKQELNTEILSIAGQNATNYVPTIGAIAVNFLIEIEFIISYQN